LILALANWFGAPRLPRAFGRAGFHVTTFGFSGLLIQRSQAVDEAIMLPESVSNDELLAALLAAVECSRADMVIPTDDTTIIALHAAVALSQRPGVSERTRAVLAASVGDPRHLATVRSRKLLADLTASVAVRAPTHGVVFSEADALAFAATHGYPIVLKEEDSAAGWGVFICKNASELKAAVLRSSQNSAIFDAGLLVQTFVEGRTAMRVVVA
jgi:biotin carboxylase